MASIKGKPRDFSPSFKCNFVGNIVLSLYQKQLIAIDIEKQSVAAANLVKYMDSGCNFRYKGKIYSTHPGAFKPWHRKVDLHVDFHKQMDCILAEEKELLMSRSRVESLLGKGISICNTVADLYAILPEQVHKYFSKEVCARMDKERITVTPRQILFYKRENEKATEHLIERMMVKMLTEKI